MEYLPQIPRCQHIKVNGTQCGSPALRLNRFCYFHKRWQQQRITLNMRARRRVSFDFPVLEDANSVQVGLMQAIRLLTSGQMDTKTAGLLLYALQTASSNLRHTNFEPRHAGDVVIDPRHIDETPLGGNLWSAEDFPEDEGEEEDDDEPNKNSDDDEDNDEDEDEPGAGYSVKQLTNSSG